MTPYPSATHKIRSPHMSAAVYVTIVNDPDYSKIVYVGVHSKDLTQYQGVSGILSLLNHILETSEEFPTQAIKELLDNHDPGGSYFIKGGKQVNSLIHHIGELLKTHCKVLGIEI